MFNGNFNVGFDWFVRFQTSDFMTVFKNGTITFPFPFTVAANTGAARTGTFYVAGQSFTITQNARKSNKRIRIILDTSPASGFW